MRLRTHIVTDAVKTDANRDASAEIAAQVEEFLQRGGVITEVPRGLSGAPEGVTLPPPKGKDLAKEVMQIRNKFNLSAKILAAHFGVTEADILRITTAAGEANGRRNK